MTPLRPGGRKHLVPHIRSATSHVRDDIRDVHLCAFPEHENLRVARLAVNLLNEETEPETVNLVGEVRGRVVGHIAFSPVFAGDDDNRLGYILAPLGVRPEYQGGGLASKLVENGIERLAVQGVDAVFVYGDPKFYGRFGFTAGTATKYLPPYDLQFPFGWQANFLHGEGSRDQVVRISCVASLRDPTLW